MHKRWVNDRFTVGVIITASVAADLCALTVLPAWEKRQVVHRVRILRCDGLSPSRASGNAREMMTDIE